MVSSLLNEAQPTPLLGRERVLETIRQRLVSREARLLTLTGPAGVGKTRLALAVGRQVIDAFADGVVLIDFTQNRDPRLVLPVIAQRFGIAEADERALLTHLTTSLRSRTLLLILDNFERLLPAASLLAHLLGSCPDITLLVTSRIPLHLRWEQTLRITPLAVPDQSDVLPPLDELSKVPSVALFLQRVQAFDPAFVITDDNARTIAELCIRLDGLPLAIELAAARTSALSPRMILSRLEQHLSPLQWQAADLPERQHSISSAIGWSYDLLTADEQLLFRQLGVFDGGFDLEAAEAIAAPRMDRPMKVLEDLASLVEKSLIQVTGQGKERVRYHLLHSIRDYAWQQLGDQGELDAVAQSHAEQYLALAERAEPHLKRRDQAMWFLRLEQEHDNLRTALSWLLAHDEQEKALRLVAAQGYFWWVRSYGTEGVRCLEEALRAAPEGSPANRTRALLWAGIMYINEGQSVRARNRLEQAHTLARQYQDRSAIAHSVTFLGAWETFFGEQSEGTRRLKEGLRQWEELSDPFHSGLTSSYLGAAAFSRGTFQDAASHYQDASARFEAVGDGRMAAIARSCLGLVVLRLGDLQRATQLVQDGVRMGMTFQDRWEITLGVSTASLLVGDRVPPEERARLLGAGDGLRRALGFSLSGWERMAGDSVNARREQLEHGGHGEAYREGRALSLADAGALTVTMLGDFSHTLAAPTIAVERVPQESVLTERELEVLRLVADRLSSRVIGKELFISASTVSYHLTSIFNKLGVDTRAQAVAVAAQRGLL